MQTEAQLKQNEERMRFMYNLESDLDSWIDCVSRIFASAK